MVEAFLGEPSEEFTDIAVEVLDEYEDFKEGLPNKQAIKDFFKDMGNVLPPDAKAAMRDFVEGLPEGDLMPANPVLCATPDQIAQACDLRAQLLEGRATPGTNKTSLSGGD